MKQYELDQIKLRINRAHKILGTKPIDIEYKVEEDDITYKPNILDEQKKPSTETRVGYATIDVMFNETMYYIKNSTVNNKFIVDNKYLIRAYKMREYLRGGNQDGKYV